MGSIVLIAVGIIFIIMGILVNKEPKFKHNKTKIDNKEQINIAAKDNGIPKNVDPKKVGNEFESYIADILKTNNIRIMEWNQGTTSRMGAYGENELKPDFYVSQKINNLNVDYWIECKFRTYLENSEFKLEDYQLKRYQKIQKESHKKVLIALGFKGIADKPKEIIIIPIDTLKRYGAIKIQDLYKFRVYNPFERFSIYIENYFLNNVFKKK